MVTYSGPLGACSDATSTLLKRGRGAGVQTAASGSSGWRRGEASSPWQERERQMRVMNWPRQQLPPA